MLLPEASRHAIADAARLVAVELVLRRTDALYASEDPTGELEGYIVEIAEDLIIAAELDTLCDDDFNAREHGCCL